MRTTVEIPDDLRELLVLEAHRTGVRGYSSIITTALRRYFNANRTDDSRKRIVEELYGSEKNAVAAEDLPTRRNWRTGSS